jgi:hypothetical protein
MRRAYPTSFCFQEMIEIILKGFFTASTDVWGTPRLLTFRRITTVAYSHRRGRGKKKRALGHPTEEENPHPSQKK